MIQTCLAELAAFRAIAVSTLKAGVEVVMQITAVGAYRGHLRLITYLPQKDIQTPNISTTITMPSSVVSMDFDSELRHSDDTPLSLH
jgi:hypothetical protein